MGQFNEITFYFARLNLMASYTDKYQYLLNSFKKTIKYQERGHEWGFFNIEEVKVEGISFITGFLVKYKKTDDEEIVDVKNKMLEIQKISNKAIATSRFFIHPKSGVISYHPVTNKIGKKQFRRITAKLIELANENLFIDADIQVIDEEIKILEEINRFDKITRVTIELHPSNPSTRHIWKKTDERLHKLQVEKYKQKYYSNKGLLISENDGIYSDIVMAGDGYGKAKMIGEKDGEKYIASTEKIPLKTDVTKDENPKNILGSILFFIKDIWNRMNDNED